MSAARRLKLVDTPPDVPAPQQSIESIDEWSAMVVGRLPVGVSGRQAAAAEIAAELADHARERARELQLAGVDEQAAARLAIEEFGDPSTLARNIHRGRTRPKRRLAMNLIVGAIAGAAVLTGGVMMTGGDSAPTQPPVVYISERPQQAEEKPITTEITDKSLGQALEEIAKAAKLSLFVRMSTLEMAGVELSNSTSVRVTNGSLADVFAELNASHTGQVPRIDYRVVGNTLEVGSYDYFARKETRLASMNIKNYVDNGGDLDALTHLIQDFVDKESWRGNGGELAELSIVDNKLFVRAPERTISKVSWVVDQLTDGQAVARTMEVPILSDLPLISRVVTDVNRTRITQPLLIELGVDRTKYLDRRLLKTPGTDAPDTNAESPAQKGSEGAEQSPKGQ